MRKCAAVVMATVVSFVAVVRGEALCLCDEDPDDCGQACHECEASIPVGLGESENCQHLDLSVDLAPVDDALTLPTADGGAPALPSGEVLPPFDSRTAVLRATSPPLPRLVSAYCSCSTRLFPRS